MQQGLVPLVHDLGALALTAARADGEWDAFVVEGYRWLGIPVADGQQTPPPSQAMALAFQESAGRFASLAVQLLLFECPFSSGVPVFEPQIGERLF
jgi:hypothetical protein